MTRGTNETVKQALRKKGVVVTSEDERALVEDKIEANHLNALRVALENGKEFGIRRFLYADGDRVLMAATEYPQSFEELSRVVTAEVNEGKPFYLNDEFKFSPHEVVGDCSGNGRKNQFN